MFCWVFIVFSRVEQVQLGLKGILMGSTGGGLAPVRRPSQNKSGPEAARRPCVGGAVAARETNGHHITMATEDLLQPGHVVKERWKVVSSAISILFCNVVFFSKSPIAKFYSRWRSLKLDFCGHFSRYRMNVTSILFRDVRHYFHVAISHVFYGRTWWIESDAISLRQRFFPFWHAWPNLTWSEDWEIQS